MCGGRKKAEGGLWIVGPGPSLQPAQVEELPGSSQANVHKDGIDPR